MPPTDNAPTTEQYQQLCQQTQAKLATLDFDNDADYKEGMDALGELGRAGALLKLAEAGRQEARER